MKKNGYNSNDEEFQHVIKLLKELPREKAPKNFEYNLHIKIENKNFTLKTEKPSLIPSWKILIPAAGTVTAALLLFTITFTDEENLENPFQITPQPRVEISNNLGSTFGTSSSNKENEIITENDVVINETRRSNRSSAREGKVVVSKEKVSKPSIKPDFPFNAESSTDLDEVLNIDKKSSSVGSSASLAGKSESKSFFNGFFIREEVDREYVDKLKARMDSIKKAHRNKELKNKNRELKNRNKEFKTK
jgi:hypothetical protein